MHVRIIMNSFLQRGCRQCRLSLATNSRVLPFAPSPSITPLKTLNLAARLSTSATLTPNRGEKDNFESKYDSKLFRSRLSCPCAHKQNANAFFHAHAHAYSQQTMKAWQIHEYSGSSGLELAHEKLIPSISSPRDVLVKIHAASVNPIDVQMASGYGRNLINLYRNLVNQDIGSSEFPLTLGRDFSGEIVDAGSQVKHLKVGDEVWGAIDAKRQGTHAEFCLASEKEISMKPKSVSHAEAAALPFVAATTFSSLVLLGGLTEKIARRKRILIFAGSGGIGSFAIQLMKSWGAEVTTTCPQDAIPLMQQLGADKVLDFRSPTFVEDLTSLSGYDIILDTIGGGTSDMAIPLLKPFVGAKYLDLAWDLISDTDTHGLPVGVAKTALGLGDKVLRAARLGAGYSWAVFLPSQKAMHTTARLVDRGVIKPVIDSVVPLEGVVEAYDKITSRKARGKIVINVAGD